MKEKKKTVALLYGGEGYEHEVSLKGALTIYPKIDTQRFDKIPILITRSGRWLTPGIWNGEPPTDEGTKGLFEALPAKRDGIGGFLTEKGFIETHAAFPLLHGDFGEDGIIQGVLENAKIPYVGQDTLTGAHLSDKAYTKAYAERLGISTVPWIYSVNEDQESAKRRAEKELGYPLFIKPARLGSSVGAGTVICPEQFSGAFVKASLLGKKRVLIEKAVKIKSELECAYFDAEGKELFTNVGEISTRGGFYDYESKYGDAHPFEIREKAEIQKELEDEVRAASKILTRGIGVRDLARIDFFLSEDGDLFFNEINPMPGFTEGSLYLRLLSHSGISQGRAVNAFIDSALSRLI